MTGETGREEGVTLVETLMASAISIIVIMTVFLTSWVTLASSESASEEFSTTAPAALAVNAVEQIVDNAIVPTGVSPFTSSCTDESGDVLEGGYGPFVYAGSGDTRLLPGSTSLSLCAVRPGTTSADTYDISFPTNGCGGLACLAIDRLSCSGSSCSWTRVDDFPGLTATNPSGNAPFTYFESNPSWTPVTPATSNLGQISAITVDFSVPTTHDKAEPPEFSRTIVLPQTLGGYS